MNLKKLLILSLLAIILLGFFQIPHVKGEQSGFVGSSKEINLEINNDGSYRLTSTFDLEKENISEIFLMVEDENTRVDISSPSKNKINGEATVEIKFTGTGLKFLNKELKKKIPGKASDLIPEQFRVFLGQKTLKNLDENPIYFLPLLEQVKSITSPIEMINNRFVEGQENKSLNNLLGTFNLESVLPIQGFEAFLPSAKVENIELTKYKWEGEPLEPPILTLGFSVGLADNNGVIENYRGNLPMSVDLSYSVSQGGDPRINLIINSDAKLPGYREKGAWNIQFPSAAKQVLEQTGMLKDGSETTFSLSVPEGTGLDKLPEDYEKTDNTTYEWSGEDGNKALQSVVEEESLEITMEEKPIQSNPSFWIGVVGAIVAISIVGIILKKR